MNHEGKLYSHIHTHRLSLSTFTKLSYGNIICNRPLEYIHLTLAQMLPLSCNKLCLVLYRRYLSYLRVYCYKKRCWHFLLDCLLLIFSAVKILYSSFYFPLLYSALLERNRDVSVVKSIKTQVLFPTFNCSHNTEACGLQWFMVSNFRGSHTLFWPLGTRDTHAQTCMQSKHPYT